MSLDPYLDMAGDRIVRAKASGFPGWYQSLFLRRWIRPLDLCHDFAASLPEAELCTNAFSSCCILPLFLKSFRFDFGIHFRQLGPYNGLPSPENRRYPELLWDMWMLWSQSRSSEPKFRWIFGITPNGLWSPPRPHFEKLFCVFLRNTKICNKNFRIRSEPHVFLKIPWRKVLVSNTKIWIRILYSVKKDHSKKFYSSAITDFCAKHALKLNSTNGCKI